MSKKRIYLFLGVLGAVVLAFVLFFLAQNNMIPGIGQTGSNGLFDENAKSLNVEVVLGEKKVTSLVEKNSTKLTLEGEKAKFDLNFPEKSVNESQEVTLQEIKTITGMGDKVELLAGVSATPNGTTLFQNAELAFSTPVVGENLMAFSFNEDGKNFHLVPLFIKNGKATIYLSHFSGYGIINVGDGSYAPPTPNAIDEQAAQLIAKIVGEAMVRQKEGDTKSFTDDELNRIYNILNVWYKLKVKIDLEQAVSNEDMIDSAFNKFNTWQAGVMLVGLEGKFSSEIEASKNTAAKAVKNAYEKASKKCSEEKDATQIAKLTKWAAFAEHWGLNGRAGLNTDDLLEKIKKCAVFELSINSTLSTPQTSVSTSASGTIQVGMDSNYNLIGSGSIQQGPWTQDGFACSYPGGNPAFPADIVSTKLTTTEKEQKVSLIMQLDEPENELKCESTIVDDFTSNLGNENWLGSYFVINYGETYIDPGKFVISDWEIVNSNGVYAKKTVNRTKTISLGVVSYAMSENTIYQLLHKPK